MILTDSTGLIALGAVEVLMPATSAFEFLTTPTVITAIDAAASRHGTNGAGARAVLDARDRLTVVEPASEPVRTSRLDTATGSVVALARTRAAPFVLTDALRVIHELDKLVAGAVITPPIVLRTLVELGQLSRQDARFRLGTLQDRRRGLEAAVGSRARAQFETVSS